MRKMREFLVGPEGETNYYHVVGRVAGRELLFGDEDKEIFRIILLKQLKFSGLRRKGQSLHIDVDCSVDGRASIETNFQIVIERFFKNGHALIKEITPPRCTVLPWV